MLSLSVSALAQSSSNGVNQLTPAEQQVYDKFHEIVRQCSARQVNQKLSQCDRNDIDFMVHGRCQQFIKLEARVQCTQSAIQRLPARLYAYWKSKEERDHQNELRDYNEMQGQYHFDKKLVPKDKWVTEF